jgi:hypothetical protein
MVNVLVWAWVRLSKGCVIECSDGERLKAWKKRRSAQRIVECARRREALDEQLCPDEFQRGTTDQHRADGSIAPARCVRELHGISTSSLR